ncbi:cytochrome c4 [Variovorax ureilyticus]|uniref:Cytochrome c4 n=1 Tax=Variovorax ureilyticus TaxID=1836198 RepID=A0ABU8VHV8_9BURK
MKLSIRFACWLAFALLACGALAQPAPTSARSDMERRMAACITCHGREGQATNSGYFPRLAGKPAGYLYEQLRSFRDGRRQQAEMSYLLVNLSDTYLREIAEYFAALDLPYPPPAPSDLSTSELARGKALVFQGDEARGIPACVSCHGQALTGNGPAIPGLLGLPRLYIASQLGAWVTRDRRALPPDCMAEVGRKLETADIRAIAGWLAAQRMPPMNSQTAVAPLARLQRDCSATGAHG